MLFQDGNGEMRGLVYAISEEDMYHPVDTMQKYRREIKGIMPEFIEG